MYYKVGLELHGIDVDLGGLEVQGKAVYAHATQMQAQVLVQKPFMLSPQ